MSDHVRDAIDRMEIISDATLEEIRAGRATTKTINAALLAAFREGALMARTTVKNAMGERDAETKT